jgi:hypothetical protein
VRDGVTPPASSRSVPARRRARGDRGAGAVPVLPMIAGREIVAQQISFAGSPPIALGTAIATASGSEANVSPAARLIVTFTCMSIPSSA